MIQPQSCLQIADNTGAREIMCIRVLSGKSQKKASLGHIILGVVKQALPNMPIKKSEIVRAVIVRTSQGVRRSNGLTVRFDQNAAVIINKEGAPRGTRIFGPVPRELRVAEGVKAPSGSIHLKILSLASEVV